MNTSVIRFSRHKYGRELRLDARYIPEWRGIGPDGSAHTLDFHELLLIERGRGWLHRDGQRTPLEGPSLVLTRPGEARRIELSDPLRLHLVVFTGDALHSSASELLTALRSGVIARPEDRAMDRLREVADHMAAEIVHPWTDTPLMLQSLLVQMLVTVGRSNGEAHLKPRQPNLLRRFDELLEREFNSEHGAAAYAARLGVSADHLSALSRAFSGVSIKTLIQRRIMREASRLLSSTDLSVAEISAALGYQEPAHFSRAFKSFTGQSPAEGRRNHGK